MHKLTQRVTGPDPFKTVHLPADAALSRLLRSAPDGRPGDSHLGQLATAASPRHSLRAARIPVAGVPVVADRLRELLARARAGGDPAAGALAGFLAGEFGWREPAPAAEPAPGPVPGLCRRGAGRPGWRVRRPVPVVLSAPGRLAAPPRSHPGRGGRERMGGSADG